MLLSVEHVTHYTYDRPVRGVVQSHRLTPASFEGQKVLSWDIEVSDGLKGGGFRDGAGDWVQGWSVMGPVSQITVTVRGLVETVDLAGVVRGHREGVAPMVYLGETAPTRADAALMAIGEEARGAGEALAQAHAMSDAIAEAIKWTTGVTRAATTAAEALAQGEGVCQDHAHALIAVARSAGIPARYVSGYLLTAHEGAQEAAHAWAELHVQGLGWVGFDPSNACCPDARYVRLGSGFDAQDAAPIRGMARGTGAESLAVSVTVAEGQRQSQQQ